MDDLKLAQDMAKYAAQGIKTLESSVEMTNSFVKYFTELLKDQEARRQLLEFYNAGLKQEEKVKKGEKLEILSYSIDPAYAKQLYRICERDHIAIVKAQCNVFDPVMDGKGDNIRTVKDSVWIYNTQQKGFNYAVAEAKARSGCEIEIPMEVARQFVQKVKNEMNPMLQITGMSLEKYIMLRQDIRKLDEDLKFTLFPRFYEKDGRDMVDVGFLSRTEVRYDKRGNFFEEQETYQISEIMKGLLAKQKMMERDEETAKAFDILADRESFKQETIDELMKERSTTILSIMRKIEPMKFELAEREELKRMLIKYSQNKCTKDDLLSAVKRCSSLRTNDQRILSNAIKELGDEIYVIPTKVIKENGELEFEPVLKESLCLGKELVIRSAGKDDMLIEEERSLPNNLNKILSDYTEQAREQGEDYGFIVLSKEEFHAIENRQPDYMSRSNRLKKSKIKFLSEKEERLKQLYKDDPSTLEKGTVEFITLINEKKERFMTQSDQTDYRLDRFDEYPHSTVENIIMEQDFEEGKEMVEEVFEELGDFDMEAMIAGKDALDLEIEEARKEIEKERIENPREWQPQQQEQMQTNLDREE